MFSKAERDYLHSLKSGKTRKWSRKYEEILRYRIRKKVKRALEDLELAMDIMGQDSLLKNSRATTENRRT